MSGSTQTIGTTQAIHTHGTIGTVNGTVMDRQETHEGLSRNFHSKVKVGPQEVMLESIIVSYISLAGAGLQPGPNKGFITITNKFNNVCGLVVNRTHQKVYQQVATTTTATHCKGIYVTE